MRRWYSSVLLGVLLSAWGLAPGIEPATSQVTLLGIGELPVSAQLRRPAGALPLLSVSEQFPQLDQAYLTAESTALAAVVPGAALPELEATPPRSWRQRLRHRFARLGGDTLAPDRVAQLLGQAGDSNLQSMATDLQDRAMRTLVDSGIDELERLEGTYLRNLELRYRTPLGDRDAMLGIEALVSLWDTGEQTLIGQVGGVWQDDEGSFNTGLGYRHLVGDGDGAVLLGTNVFYDYLADPSLQRYSVGVEAKSKVLDLYANWYQAVGGRERLNSGEQAYTPDGWDIELAGRIPQLPWVEFSGQYFRWRGELGQSDDQGIRYAINLRPVPLFSLAAQYENPERGRSDWGLEAEWKYRFGVALSEQLRPQRVHAHDPRQRRFEQVQRSYEMRVERARARVGGIVGTRVDGAMAAEVGNVRAETVGMTTVQVTLNVPGARVPARAPGSATLQELGLRVELRLAGTATAGEDYELSAVRASGATVQDEPDPTELTTDGRYQFYLEANAEEVELVLELMLTDDDVFEEEPESIVLELVSGNTVTLLQISDAGTGDDPALTALPAVSVTVDPLVPLMEAASGNMAMLTLSASGTLTSDLTVSYLLSGDLVGYTLTGHPGEPDPTRGTVMLPMAGTPVILTLTVTDDAVSEPLQFLRFLLQPSPAASPTYRLDSPSSARIEVAPSDPEIRFVAASAQLNEGSPEAVEVTVEAVSGLTRDVTVSIQISGSANPDTDYTLTGLSGSGLSRSLLLPAANPRAILQFAGLEDETLEGVEMAILTLSPVSGQDYAVAEGGGRFELNLLDEPPGVEFAEPDSSEVLEGASVTIRVVPNRVPGEILLVPLALGGEAQVGTDFEFVLSGTEARSGGVIPTGDESMPSYMLLFPSGSTGVQIEIRTLTDDFPDGDQDLQLDLQADGGGGEYLVGLRSRYILTIRDADSGVDAQPRVQFSDLQSSVSEDDPQVVIDIRIANPLDEALTITYTVDAEATTAVADVDYSAPSGSLSVAGGQTQAQLRIQLLDDADADGIKQIVLVLQDAEAYNLGSRFRHAVSIADDEALQPVPQVSFSVPTSSAREGTEALVQVSVAPVPTAGDLPVSFQVNLGSGLGAADAADYVTPSGTITIARNSPTGTLRLALLGGDGTEGAETLTLELTASTIGSYSLGGQSTHVLTINDGDTPELSFDPANQLTADERDGSMFDLAVRVLADQPVGSAGLNALLTILPESTALLGAAGDYQFVGLDVVNAATQLYQLSFAANSRSAQFTLRVLDDDLTEGPEVVQLQLRPAAPDAAVPYSVLSTGNEYRLTIGDSDISVPTSVFISSSDDAIDELSTAAIRSSTITLEVSDLPVGTSMVTVNLQARGTATRPGLDNADYSLSVGGTPLVSDNAGLFQVEVGATPVDITAEATDDALDEPEEFFALELVPTADYRRGDEFSTGVSITIADDDVPQLGFATAASMSVEGTVIVSIEVTADIAPWQDLSIPYAAVAGSTATSGSDYATLSAAVTLPRDQLSADISLSLLEDALDEPDETLQLALTTPIADAGYVLGTPSSHTLTIQDDEDPQIFFPSNSRLNSALESAGTLPDVPVTVRPAPHTGVAVMVPVTVAGGAVLGTDYNLSYLDATSNRITLAPGTSTFNLPIPSSDTAAQTVNNLRLELIDNVSMGENNPVMLTLGTPTPGGSAVLGTENVYLLAIGDDDAVTLPTANLVVDSATDQVGETAGANARSVGVSLSAAPGDGNTVLVSLSLGGSATIGMDYRLSASELVAPVSPATLYTVTFSGTVTQVDLSVDVIDDAVDEPLETLVIQLSPGTGYRAGPATRYALGIVDNDTAPLEVQFAQAASSVSEGIGAGVVLIPISADADAPTSGITVTYTVAEGVPPAVSGEDYTALSGTVSILAGTRTGSIIVTLTNDALDEADESLQLTLASGSGYTIGSTSSHELTILNDDEPVASFDSSAGSVTEGSATATTLDLVLSPAPRVERMVPVAVSGVTSEDYSISVGGTPVTLSGGRFVLTVPARAGTAPQSSVQLSLVAVDNTDTAGARSAQLSLQSGTGYSVNATNALYTLTITEDDVPAPEVSFVTGASSDTVVQEDAGSPATVTLELDRPVRPAGTPAPVAVTVSYRVTGTAESGTDFTALSGTVMFPQTDDSGPQLQTLQVTPLDDDLDELAETVRLILTASVDDSYIVSSPDTHELSIQDDDMPVLSFATATTTVAEDATAPANQVTLTVNATPIPAGRIEVPIEIDEDLSMNVVESTDYSLSGLSVIGTGRGLVFTSGQGSVTFSVTVINDDLFQGGVQSLVLTLLAAGGSGEYMVNATANTHTLTITEDDVASLVPAATFSAPTSPAEEDAASALVEVGLSLPAPLGGVRVSYRFLSASSSARAGTDFNLPAGYDPVTNVGMIDFAAGDERQELSFALLDDDLSEAPETISLRLLAGAGYTLGTGTTHELTINDDEPPTLALGSSDLEATEADNLDPADVVLTATGTVPDAGVTVSVDIAPAPAANSYRVQMADGTVLAPETESPVPPGSARYSVSITAAGDTTLQILAGQDQGNTVDETLAVSLVTSTDYRVAGAALTVTLADNDADLGLCATDAVPRTPIARSDILGALSTEASQCASVTATDLAGITGTLSISVTSITALLAGDYAGLTALEGLSLASSNITTLPVGIFDGLSSLQTLNLADTELTTLPAGVFRQLSALRILTLIRTDIDTLPSGIFDGLTALEELHLDNNMLSSLPGGIFDDLAALQMLLLNDNMLSSLPGGIFDNLDALQMLFLNNNMLSSLPGGIFDNLNALLRLDLDDNDDLTLEAGLFTATLDTLTDLNLNFYTPVLVSITAPASATVGVPAVFMISITGPLLEDAVLSYSAFGAFTPLENDFTEEIAAGATSTTIMVTPDVADELEVALNSIIPPGANSITAESLMRRGSPISATVTVEAPPTLALGSSDLEATEADESDPADVVLTATGTVPDAGVTVSVDIAPAPAANSYSVQTADGAVLTPETESPVPPGSARYSVSITAAGDTTLQILAGQDQGNTVDETLAVNLVTSTDYMVAGTALTVTLVDNDDDLGLCATDAMPRSSVVTREILEELSMDAAQCASVTAAVLGTIMGPLSPDATDLTELLAGDFAGLTSVQELRIVDGEINTLPAGIFDELSSLQTLSLVRNGLTTLPAGIFSQLSALQSLNLGDNAFETLPAGAFNGLTALEELFLENNMLSSLPGGIFDDLAALQRLFLEDNMLSSLPGGIFDNLAALQRLNLNGNVALTLEPGLFAATLDTLTELNLDFYTPVAVSVSAPASATVGVPAVFMISITGTLLEDAVLTYRVFGDAFTPSENTFTQEIAAGAMSATIMVTPDVAADLEVSLVSILPPGASVTASQSLMNIDFSASTAIIPLVAAP